MGYESGEIIPYLQMCVEEGTNLQRGMNYKLKPLYSVVLMSVRTGAPYRDRVEDDSRILIYEGHDIANRKGGVEPKSVDQPMYNPGGSLTQNGLFYQAAISHKENSTKPELVRVYEKIRDGIWVYNGFFELIDAWQEYDGARNVFKFKLRLTSRDMTEEVPKDLHLEHSRFIPREVKIEVWKRDNGRCVTCGSDKNLHFDHVIPFSKGGTSLKSENIQLLCAVHNLSKRDKIE